MATGAGGPSPRPKQIDHFKRFIRGNTLDGACGRKFIRVVALKRWLRDGDRVLDLLKEAYNKWPDPGLPTRREHMERGDSLLIFSILLDLGHGGLVHYFCKRDLTLPMKQLDILETYRQAMSETYSHVDLGNRTPEDLTELFHRRQWAFCPAFIRHSHTGTYAEDRVLPIKVGDKILVNNKGGTAQVWQVIILEEFLEDALKNAIPESRIPDEKDGLGARYQLAIKSFAQEKISFFDTEVKAFQALENHTGMVRFFGHFDQKMTAGTKSYHIIMEYGQFDLDEYFFTRDVLPPRLPNDVESFWKDMRNIAGAVKDLHFFKGPVQRDDSHLYYGWHADIKPDNILLVNRAFKLADPGFATFRRAEHKDELTRRVKQTAQGGHISTMINGGTATYGAPECKYGQLNRDPVTRSIDIWSLGCVFSVAATWVILGPLAVQQFHAKRQQAIENFIERQKGQPNQSKLTPKQEETLALINCDCFHDGKKVLDFVTEWHILLRKAASGTDWVTSEVLNLIDHRMLTEAANRIEATELCIQLDKILRDAQDKCKAQGFGQLLDELANIKEAVTKLPSQQELLTSDHSTHFLSTAIGIRERRKSNLYPRIASSPFKSVTYNSASIPQKPQLQIQSHSQSRVPLSPLSKEGVPAFAVTVPENEHSSTASLQSPPQANTPKTGDQTHPEETSLKAPLRTETSGDSSASFPTSRKRSTLRKQTPWQAAAELKKSPVFFKLKTKFGLQKLKKDPELAKYFENRDLHFLVDNTNSMVDKWDEVTWLLEILISKSAGLDEDGMDLSFSNGEHNVRGKEHTSDFSKKMEAARPQDNRKVDASIATKLAAILDEYRLKIQDRPSLQTRKLTILILTDGIWEGMSDKTAVESLIIDNYKKMDKILKSNWKDKRQLTFQFIQFGYNLDATYRLQGLDDLMQYQHPIPDIIDTVDSRSDVYKMLLGSFVPEYDEDQEDGPRLSRIHTSSMISNP